MKIIIPCAGSGRRMKSYGAKALIPVANGEKLILRQVRLIKQVFNQCDIIAVIGYEANRIRQQLPKEVSTIFNEEFEETNVAYSIALALEEIPEKESVVIIFGDLVFDKSSLESIDISKSSVIVEKQDNPNREEEVGVNANKGKVVNFSYGIKNKWRHICHLKENERVKFGEIAMEPFRCKHFCFEVFNQMLLEGCQLSAIESVCPFVEIDSSKDILDGEKIA